MLLAIRALVGMVLGGLLGTGCGYLFHSLVGGSKWIRADGLVYDVIATLAIVAVPVGFCAGSVAGALLMLRSTESKTASASDGHRPLSAGQTPDEPERANRG